MNRFIYFAINQKLLTLLGTTFISTFINFLKILYIKGNLPTDRFNFLYIEIPFYVFLFGFASIVLVVLSYGGKEILFLRVNYFMARGLFYVSIFLFPLTMFFSFFVMSEIYTSFYFIFPGLIFCTSFLFEKSAEK